MNAVFTDSPYKCWNYGAKGELHIFEDDVAGKEFARLNDFCLSESPNDWMETGSWCGLVANWMDFGGSVVLHYSDDEVDGWIDWLADNHFIHHGCTVSYERVNRFDAAVRLPEWSEFGTSHRLRCLALMRMMVEVYDVWPIEFWDGDECVGDCVTLNDVAA